MSHRYVSLRTAVVGLGVLAVLFSIASSGCRVAVPPYDGHLVFRPGIGTRCEPGGKECFVNEKSIEVSVD